MNNAPRTSPTRAQRRSARIPLRVRLVIHASNEPQTDAETVLISRYGAKLRVVRTHRQLASGEHIRLCKRGSYTWLTARVVWLDRITGSYYGIELETKDNFWGVSFPEDGSARNDAGDLKARRGFATVATANGGPFVPPPMPSIGS